MPLPQAPNVSESVFQEVKHKIVAALTISYARGLASGWL
jgi:hypothetical protein